MWFFFCVCPPASEGAETEGVLQSAGLQEAEETPGGEEGGESAEEAPPAWRGEDGRVVSDVPTPPFTPLRSSDSFSYISYSDL